MFFGLLGVWLVGFNFCGFFFVEVGTSIEKSFGLHKPIAREGGEKMLRMLGVMGFFVGVVVLKVFLFGWFMFVVLCLCWFGWFMPKYFELPEYFIDLEQKLRLMGEPKSLSLRL